MQYTETELAKLIETVEKEFTTHLNKAEEAHVAALSKSEGSVSGVLAKAEDSEPPKEKKESKDKKESKPESKEAAPKEEGAPAPAAEAAPAEEGAPAPAEGEASAEAPAAAAPAEGAAPAAGHGYDDEDMAHMLKMYQSMSREELLAHHDCVRQCLDAQGAAQAAPAAAEAAPAPAQEAAAPAAPAFGKSEIEDENPVLNSKPTDKGSNTNAAYNKNTGGKVSATAAPTKSPGAKSPASKVEGVQMNKSENTEVELLKSELEASKASNEELKKNFDKATEVLAKLVSKVSVPQGKAITSLDTITKSEGAQEVKELTKSEVTELLKSKDVSKLTKSDRDAINSFYLGGSNFNTISHLFKN